MDKIIDVAKTLNEDVILMCIDDAASSSQGVNVKIHDLSEVSQADEAEIPAVEIQPDDVVALPYSSGTSGVPKGVMLTHKNLVTTVGQLVDGENPTQYTRNDDVLLCVLPLFHIYALNSIFLCGIRAGATIVIMSKFEMTTLLEAIERHKVTVASFVPPILLAIAKSEEVERYDLSSVRMVVTGAAPVSQDLVQALRAKLPRAVIGQVIN